MTKSEAKAVLAQVDPGKLPLSSYIISRRKYDAIASLYTMLLLSSAVSYARPGASLDELRYCVAATASICDNPQHYSYDETQARIAGSMEEAYGQVVKLYGDDSNACQKQELWVCKLRVVQEQLKKQLQMMLSFVKTRIEIDSDAVFEQVTDPTYFNALVKKLNASQSGTITAKEAVVEPTDEKVVRMDSDTAHCPEQINEKTDATSPKHIKKKVSWFRRLFTKQKRRGQ